MFSKFIKLWGEKFLKTKKQHEIFLLWMHITILILFAYIISTNDIGFKHILTAFCVIMTYYVSSLREWYRWYFGTYKHLKDRYYRLSEDHLRFLDDVDILLEDMKHTKK